ncbi:MAG: 1-acyl-sn-glycerol-3-phosphate acyltransferase [Bacteroidota bacterium]
MRFLWKLYFRLIGWKIRVPFPINTPKAVIIVAPHTCVDDLFIGLAARSILRLKSLQFFGKQELFKGPTGFLLRHFGGHPVDRFSKKNMVDQAVDLFNENSEFLLALSPEGTRKKVERLRTGFYYIAHKANVPIVMVAFDFANKEIRIEDPFFTSNDEAADFKKIIHYFATVKGKYPELGLSHLQFI